MSAFFDPEAVARYAERPIRMVPGFLDMQKMADVLLAERVPDDGTVLVLGAGGGLELRAFADRHAGWRFVGVDPSAEMLNLASQVTVAHAERVTLITGMIDDAPPGPFDGATCLLTLHFVARHERLPLLLALRERLKPGAPLVVAHLSFPQLEPEKALWLDRYAAYAAASGVKADHAALGASKIGRELPILSPQDDEAMLREAGFTGVSLFYAGLAFCGWVATSP